MSDNRLKAARTVMFSTLASKFRQDRHLPEDKAQFEAYAWMKERHVGNGNEWPYSNVMDFTANMTLDDNLDWDEIELRCARRGVPVMAMQEAYRILNETAFDRARQGDMSAGVCRYLTDEQVNFIADEWAIASMDF